MNAEAQHFLLHLPSDQDSYERSTTFRDLIQQTRCCSHCLATAEGLYRAAAAGEWSLNSLHDLNMVICALELNPRLLAQVRHDVDLLVIPVRHGDYIQGTWSWIQSRCQISNCSGTVR